MTLDQITTTAINPALAWLPPKMDTPEARLMVLTIGNQESEFKNRVQMGNGPARSFWQMERMGGVNGVLTHPASRELAGMACDWRNVPHTAMGVWSAMEFDDVLGAIWARLLLLTDPRPLPAWLAVDDAWNYYLDNWRPGKPHADKWPGYHLQSRNFLKDK